MSIMWAICVILNFLIATLKKNNTDEINFDNVFSLTHYIQNSIWLAKKLVCIFP